MRYKVIAECGINHLGDMNRAKQMIDETEKAGADGVKFQFYDWTDIEEEFADVRALPNTTIENPLIQQVKQSQLSLSQLAELSDHARSVGLGFICTPFKRTRRVVELATLKPDAIKIRYKDFDEDSRMVETAVSTQVPLVLVSCSSPKIDNMALFWNKKIRWLACIPKYPPAPEDFNLSRDSAFNGFSDHYPHITASLLAASVTSQPEFIIEKHVLPNERSEMGDSVRPKIDVPDYSVSITFKQLAELVQHLRLIEKLRPNHQTHWQAKHRG